MINRIILAAAAVTVAIASMPAQAANLVTNAGFEQTTNGLGQFDNNTSATGWSSNGYNFIFSGADVGGTVQGSYGGLSLWAPSNGSNNGFVASPTGGNFIGADGAFGIAPVQQTLTGLVIGKQYAVSFDWAAAQQTGFDGATTERWHVSLGNQTISTDTYQNANHGFSGWMHEKFIFTAQSTSSVLSFLAEGTPDGKPPFSLLDGVSATAAVPEPATWAMMLTGFGLVGAATRRRRGLHAPVAA